MGIFHGQTVSFQGENTQNGCYSQPGGFHLPSRRRSGLSLETVALGASTGFNFQRLRKDKLCMVDELWDLDTVDGWHPARTPIEVGSLSHYSQGSFYITGGWEWDFWTINSFSGSSFWLSITKLGGQIHFTQSLHSWKLTRLAGKSTILMVSTKERWGFFMGKLLFFREKMGAIPNP